MADTLEIFGVEYQNVAGIKATDDNNQIKTYIRPQGTKSISANGTGIDVTSYASVDVDVSGGAGAFVDTVEQLAGGGDHHIITGVDISSDTVTAEHLEQGYTAHDSSGNAVVGTLVAGGGITIDSLATNTEPSGSITLGNEVTQLGDYALAGKPITSIYAPSVTSVASTALQSTQITTITDANFPSLGVNSQYIILLRMSSLTSIKLTGEKLALSSGSGAIRDNANLVTIEFPNCAKNVGASYRGMGSMCFYGDTKLEMVDIGFCQSIGGNAFYNATKIRTIIMRRTDAIVTLPNWNTNTMNGIYNNPTESTIYVPNDLISTYQTATNWSSAYTAGVTFTAIEGSIYE